MSMVVAKRFTDTEKWKKAWFLDLSPRMKAAWEYLRDNCDHAGVWSPNFRLMSFQLGTEVTAEDCEGALNDAGRIRFKRLASGKFLLTDFVDFQYPNGLSKDNRAHQGVLKALEREGISYPLDSSLLAPSEDLRSTINGAKDKDKDKDKEKDKEASAVFEELYREYPKRKGTQRKKAALASFSKNFRSADAREKLLRAVRAYRYECQAEKKVSTPYVMQIATFLGGPWEEYAERAEAKPVRLKTFDEVEAEALVSGA